MAQEGVTVKMTRLLLKIDYKKTICCSVNCFQTKNGLKKNFVKTQQEVKYCMRSGNFSVKRSQASIFQNCLRQIGPATKLFFLMFCAKKIPFLLYLCSVCLGCKLVLEYFLDGLKWLLKFSILRLLRWKFCEFCRLTLRSKSSGGKSSNLASGRGWYLEDKLCSTKVIKILNFHYDNTWDCYLIYLCNLSIFGVI